MHCIRLLWLRTTFFVWHCGFLAHMWQFLGLRDLVKQGDFDVALFTDLL
jgi:hypothetical protein